MRAKKRKKSNSNLTLLHFFRAFHYIFGICHSTDSRAPNTSGSRCRAQGEGSLPSTRKVSNAHISAIFLQCARLRTTQEDIIQGIRRWSSFKTLPAAAAPSDGQGPWRQVSWHEGKIKTPQTKLNKMPTTIKTRLSHPRWRGERWPQKAWTNTRFERCQSCMLPDFKRRS